MFTLPPSSSLASRFALGACLLVSATWLTACGGKSTGQGADGDSPQGCTYAGKAYANSDSFPDQDGCNTCSCDDGQVSCTLAGCGPGTNPQPGISCEQVDVFYDQLVKDGKSCDPDQSNPCSYRVSSALGCGCDTFVNPNNWNTDLAKAYASHHQGQSCGSNLNCEMCGEPPLRGRCTVQGRCEDTNEPAGPACKVGGVVYVNGATGIPAPTSCNVCSCQAGQLLCTEKACPVPCPSGTVLTTSCAQCGPTDSCEIVEHACYPTCVDTCESGTCISGACLPGICF